MQGPVSDIRKNYSLKSLLETEVSHDPIHQFGKWWEEALAAQIDEVNAMTLATASPEGFPSARIVLLKNFGAEGFSFFTNYKSFKGTQLNENPRACLVFFWKELERQVRITGTVEKLDEESNDSYFESRPVPSQIGAITSPQSSVIQNRDWLRDLYRENEKLWEGKQIERPEHWGGYLVKPTVIEFWQGQPGRLHDRLQYNLLDGGQWKLERLAP